MVFLQLSITVQNEEHEFYALPGGHDDDLGPGGCDPDLDAGVAILGQLAGQELVQLGLEHAIGDELEKEGEDVKLCRVENTLQY